MCVTSCENQVYDAEIEINHKYNPIDIDDRSNVNIDLVKAEKENLKNGKSES